MQAHAVAGLDFFACAINQMHMNQDEKINYCILDLAIADETHTWYIDDFTSFTTYEKMSSDNPKISKTDSIKNIQASLSVRC